jgi:predicted dehydrogenase
MKIGVIGCGVIATHHLPHILKHPGVETVGLVDLDQQKAKETAEQFDLTHVYPSFAAMHQALGVDVVHILTPPATHARLAIEAMEAGCHVLVEKPMALTQEDADEMIAAAARNGVKLGVDHNFLFNPIVQKAEALVRSGAVGRLTHVEAQYSFDLSRLSGLNVDGSGPSHWALQLPGGLLTDHIPHPASILLHFLAGPVVVGTISKQNGILPDGLPDELRVLIDAGAVTGLLSVSLGTRPDCFTVNIYGTEMSLHANLTNMSLVARKNRRISKKLLRVVDNLDQAAQLLTGTLANSLRLVAGKVRPPGDVGPVITAFYQSIDGETNPAISAEAGRQLVLFMKQVWQPLT